MARKIALMFPGQGAQFEKMGEDICNTYPNLKDLAIKSSEFIQPSPYENCMNLSLEELSITKNSQPALFLMSALCFELFKSLNIDYDGVLGFSLGEICALYASGVFNYEDALKVINHRAKCMQEASEKSGSGMFAILGLNRDKITEICNASTGYVVPVNFNCPTQTVIAGEYPYLQEVADKCVEEGALRAVQLKVSAGFHSKLMQDASVKFYDLIKDIKTNKLNKEFYSNVTADKLPCDEDIYAYLQKQMTNAVEFEKAVRQMIANGYTTFIELGAGRVLSGLVKKIDRSVEIFNVQDVASFEKLKTALSE